MGSMTLEIGRALRQARLARGLTLRELAAASADRFRPTSLAGYERGERKISVERFCELCRLLDVPPERLLADIIRATEGPPEPKIDLTLHEASGTTESLLVSEFVRQVASFRGERDVDRIVLRAGDVEVLATASGRRPDELLEIIRPARRRDRHRTPE